MSFWLYIVMLILSLINWVVFLFDGGTSIKLGITAIFFLGWAILMAIIMAKHDIMDK
jgi:hypothetical protein